MIKIGQMYDPFWIHSLSDLSTYLRETKLLKSDSIMMLGQENLDECILGVQIMLASTAHIHHEKPSTLAAESLDKYRSMVLLYAKATSF